MSEPTARDPAAFDSMATNETLAKKSALGGVVTIAAQLGRVVIQIVGVAVVSRLCSPSDYGLLAMAVTVTGFVALFTDMGLSAATVQRETIDQHVTSTLFYVNMGFGLALFLLAAIASPIAALLFDDQRVIPLIMILATAIPITAAGAQHAALLTRRMQWISIQGIGLIAHTLGLAATIMLAATLDQPYYALTAQSVVAAIIATSSYWLLSGWRPSFSLDIRKARSELGFGAYLSGFNFVNYLHDQFDNVLLGWRFGSVELGYYSRAYSLLQMPLNLINGAITQTALPSLSRLAPRHDDWTRAFLNLATACAFASMALSSALFVASQPLVELLLGSQWTPVGELFRYLMVASIFGSASSVCGSAFISLGKTKAYFRWALFASPVFAVSYIIGLPWASVGIAVAYSVSMAVLSPIYLAVTAKLAGFSFFQAAGRIVPFMMAAGATCFLGIEAMRHLSVASLAARLGLSLAVAVILYLAITLSLICLLPIYRDFRTVVMKIVRRNSQDGAGSNDGNG